MSAAEQSLEGLARDAKRGSETAFGRLAERLQEPLYNFLLMRTRNAADAEELAQEAFLRAWLRIRTYDERWRFSTWLFAVARNLAASHHRAAGARIAPAAALEEPAGDADPARDLTRTELRRGLWDLAARVLSEEQRDALWLRYAEDLPPLEIARILGRRPSSVRVLLFRARARLAEHLSGEEPGSASVPVPIKIAGDPR